MKRIFIILSAILFSTHVFSQAGLPNTLLTAWYPFCADTTDHSTGGHTLNVGGPAMVAPVLTTDRFGVVKSAYEFNGVNSSMHYTTFFSSSGDFSYSCWINAYTPQSSSIIYNGKVTTNGFGLVMNDGTFGQAGDTVALRFGSMGQQLGSPITLNQWHHLVFTKSASTYEMYVDTVLIGTYTGIFYPLTSPDVFNVGFDYLANQNGFNGKIDDIAVYSKHLSAAEVGALYRFNPDVYPFTLGNDTAICTNTLVLAPSVNTPGGDYTWSIGNTVLPGTDTTLTITPSDAGNQYILTISKALGCTFADTINVRHITPRLNIGPRDTTFCGGLTYIANNHPAIPGETYTWSTGATTQTITISMAGTYSLVLDSAGCMNTDTITVHLLPQPPVHLGPDTSSCNGSPVTLQSSDTYTGAATYVWQALPILASPATTPTFVASVTGTYWLTVTDNGCAGADTIHVVVVYDTFHFYQGDTAVCLGKSINVKATVNPNISYQWTPTTGMPTSNVATPVITTSISATYVLTATYPNSGCPDIIDSFHLDIQPNPVIAFFGPPRSVCSNDTVHITAVVSPADYTGYIFNWSPGTNLDDPTAQTVVFTPGDSTNLILVVSTPAGCSAKDSIQINVHPIAFDIIGTHSPICPGDSFQLAPVITNTVVPTATYQWIPDIYLSNANSASPWIKPITSQSYIIVGTTQFGCKDTVDFSIIVHPAAVIYLEDSVQINPGESYIISPQTNCTRFSWSPEIGLNDTTASNPIATPTANTTYKVYATTQFGCATTDSIRIRISPTVQLVLPNAFTPGAGINNVFKIIRNGDATIDYFRIFDRWGKLLFETNDVDAGWDGMYKGKPQPFGVYVYELEGITSKGTSFKQHGNVTLIR